MAVRVEVTGERPQLTAGVDLAAYRVVQEAITNVIKHAGTSECVVAVGYEQAGVRVTVTDAGTGTVAAFAAAAVEATGHGIAGMRERVTAYGGQFDAGPRPDHGFAVSAHISGPGNGPVIRVLVADDQALLRGSFRVLVDTAPDLTTVGEAATGAEAVAACAREKPDVVLMDIRMPGMDGIEATRRICASSRGDGC